jgi:hypothetical protein
MATGLPDHRFVIVGQADEVRRGLGARRPTAIRRVVLTVRAVRPARLYNRDRPLYPSLYEGRLARSRGDVRHPVLTSDGSSPPGGRGAALSWTRFEDALADALVRLAQDAHLRADLRARGLSRAAEFSWERTARETIEVYREVAEEGRGRG